MNGWDQPLTPPVQPPVASSNIPPAQAVQPPPVPPVSGIPTTSEFKGLPVRAGGDRVFLLKDGKKHWIMTAETFARLGFKFGDEVKIDEATLAVLPEGEPIK